MTPSPLLNQAKLCSPLTKKILHAPDSSIHPRIPAEPQLKAFFFFAPVTPVPKAKPS